jgi:hypothetical protein
MPGVFRVSDRMPPGQATNLEILISCGDPLLLLPRHHSDGIRQLRCLGALDFPKSFF